MKFEYDNIVIGSDLRALLFAFVNQYPIFNTEIRPPHRFDYFDLDANVEMFHIDNSPTTHKTFNDTHQFGAKRLFLWEKINFLLSVEGLAPLSNLCENIRYDGEKLICSNEYSKICEIKFDKCFYFGDNNTYKLVNQKSSRDVRFKVFDFVGFKRGGKHEIDYIETSDDFVRKVWFYSSDRICGNTGVKDACVLSVLDAEQLNHHSHTQTMTSFKLIKILKDNGLRGKFNGFNKYGTPRYYNFKTINIARQKFRIDQPEWEETESVKKVTSPIEELLEMARSKDLTLFSYLNENTI